MGLLVTSYLVLINISAASTQDFQMNVFTAMDAWLYGCKIFITAALFEFAWVLRLRNKQARGEKFEHEIC
jgi:hypothetical protein